MSQWVIKGIRTGIKTTAYPRDAENAAGVTPGLPRGGGFGADARRSSNAASRTRSIERTEKSRWTAAAACTATAASAASSIR